ncbi:hypothetical protein GCM10020218_001700 [Dactylosporangium vinaceum]
MALLQRTSTRTGPPIKRRPPAKRVDLPAALGAAAGDTAIGLDQADAGATSEERRQRSRTISGMSATVIKPLT